RRKRRSATAAASATRDPSGAEACLERARRGACGRNLTRRGAILHEKRCESGRGLVGGGRAAAWVFVGSTARVRRVEPRLVSRARRRLVARAPRGAPSARHGTRGHSLVRRANFDVPSARGGGPCLRRRRARGIGGRSLRRRTAVDRERALG